MLKDAKPKTNQTQAESEDANSIQPATKISLENQPPNLPVKTGFFHPINSYTVRMNQIKSRIDREQQYYRNGGTAENKQLDRLIQKAGPWFIILVIIAVILKYWLS